MIFFVIQLKIVKKNTIIFLIVTLSFKQLCNAFKFQKISNNSSREIVPFFSKISLGIIIPIAILTQNISVKFINFKELVTY